MRWLHGTSSGCAESILKQGIRAPAYLTPDMDEAEYYAATGGEASLQRREEQFEKDTGVNARKHFYPDMWDMYFSLYPSNERPVVIELDLPIEIHKRLQPDSGAFSGMVADFLIPPECIVKVHDFEWPSETSQSREKFTG
jgi:hypothetical protein